MTTKIANVSPASSEEKAAKNKLRTLNKEEVSDDRMPEKRDKLMR